MILELKGIFKNYQQGKMSVPVLKDVNFSMEEGEYVAIMGPSGSGKTTLMNIIGCLDKPTEGKFFLDGQDILNCSENDMSDIRLNKIGFVFQSFHLLPRQSALANVELPLNYAKVPKKERRERAMKALERVGLADRVDFQPNQLSGGQQQRVALARALVIEPSVLLFDEPLSNLDAKLRVTMRTEIRKIQQKVGITAIYVTHDQSEAMSISDKIIIMSKGKVEQIGTPREIYYHPKSRFVADFIGEANFLKAKVKSVNGEKAVIDVIGEEIEVNNYGEKAAGEEASLVLRPEAVVLSEKGLLEGTVTLSTFMGSYQYYQVMVGDMEIQITDYNPVNRRIYEVGEKAYLDFDPHGVYIL